MNKQSRGVLASIALAAGMVLVPAGAFASSYTYQTINDPADNALQPTAVFNQLLGINNGGVIAGYFGDGAVVPNNGFTYASGAFTPENVSGADQTQVVAINNTLTNGTYDTAGFWVNNASGANHGFTNIGGTTTNVDGPSSTFTQVLGLNDNHQAVGFYTAAGVTNGFTYNTSTAALTTLAATSLNATAVTATGINNNGVIVGFFTTCAGCIGGFIDNNGTFTTPTDPNGTNPMFFGINNLGEIVGTDTSTGGFSQGFVYDMGTGTWTTVFDPLAEQTTDGFNISGTTLNGINDQGQLVGFYADANGNVDGLLATPVPEPASLALMALAGIGLGVTYRARRRNA